MAPIKVAAHQWVDLPTLDAPEPDEPEEGALGVAERCVCSSALAFAFMLHVHILACQLVLP